MKSEVTFTLQRAGEPASWQGQQVDLQPKRGLTRVGAKMLGLKMPSHRSALLRWAPPAVLPSSLQPLSVPSLAGFHLAIVFLHTLVQMPLVVGLATLN